MESLEYNRITVQSIRSNEAKLVSGGLAPAAPSDTTASLNADLARRCSADRIIFGSRSFLTFIFQIELVSFNAGFGERYGLLLDVWVLAHLPISIALGNWV